MPLSGFVRLLIVDDDPEDILFIQDLLADDGSLVHEVLTASHANEADAILRSADVDLCIVDQHLGKGSGIEFIESLGPAGIPAILMSGVLDSDVEDRARSAGAVDFVDKQDVSSKSLVRTIRFAHEVGRRRRLERSMARDLVEEVQEERARISRDLHDGLGQDIHGIGFLVRSWLSGPPDGTVGRDDIEMLDKYIQKALRSVRQVIEQLDPVGDVVGGFPKALRRHKDRIEQIYMINVDLVVDDVRVPDDAAQDLLRVVQEASSNAIRHGGADRIRITLGRQAGEIQLEHGDNGGGFDVGAVVPGRGLENMRFRMAQRDGRLEVLSSRGAGCRIRATLRAASEKDGAAP